MPRKVAIIGAGVVGSALARELADHATEVTVLERGSAHTMPGSTGHAPGFIGLYLHDHVHIDLARESAEVYDAFPAAFRRVGALDVADSIAGAEGLAARAEAARSAGLAVREIPVAEAAERAPALVDPARVTHALWSDLDGAADARALVTAIREDARARGARFRFDSPVQDVEKVPAGWAVRSAGEALHVDDIVLAAGFWGGRLAEQAGAFLPLVPVGHPYVYSAPQVRQAGGPLVRFGEHGVYMRVHGDRIGMGTYVHEVVDATEAIDGTAAELTWPGALFDAAVDREIALLPPASRFAPAERLNGVFSLTPDGRPYLGPVTGVPGLWAAQAIWVTHAAGAARRLARMMRAGEGDAGPFDPMRFADDREEWPTRCLAQY